MNITQAIKNLKYNQRSPKISLIVENNNDEIKVKDISVQQGDLLEKNTMEENFLLDSQLHVVTSDIDGTHCVELDVYIPIQQKKE